IRLLIIPISPPPLLRSSGANANPAFLRRLALRALLVAVLPPPRPRVLVERRQLNHLAAPRAQPVLPQPRVLEEDAERLQRAQHQPVQTVEEAELDDVGTEETP